jgi:hypothetical protein
MIYSPGLAQRISVTLRKRRISGGSQELEFLHSTLKRTAASKSNGIILNKGTGMGAALRRRGPRLLFRVRI